MKRTCLFLLCFLVFLSFLCSEEVSKASSKEKYRKFSARFSFQGEPLFAGKAGKGSHPPGYREAFQSGLGGGLEIGFSFHPRHQAFIGIEDKDYKGQVFEGVKFANRKIALVYAGWKMNLFSTQESSLKPYLKVEIGTASLNKIEIIYHDIHNDYWDSSRVPMLRAGVGIELILFEWKPYSNGVFLEIKGQYLGKPPSLMSPHSDSGGCWSLPISLGLSFNL